MLKLRHTLKPDFGNSAEVDYHLVFKPLSPELWEELRPRVNEVLVTEARQICREHLLEANGLVDENDKPVPSAEALAELLTYRAFVGEVFVLLFNKSAVTEEEGPTSGR